MPEPIKRGQRYMPGLDGLRAIAVLAVIAYHLDFGWATGGLLGVGVFFTLSGYLITDLLLAQFDERGRIRLKAFWFARARRLLPALFVMLLVVMAWVTVIGPHQPPDFRSENLSAIFYVNNWWLIFHHVSYFAQFAAPSPLGHLWSLSIEEQFYILWPFLLTLGVRLIPEVKLAGGVRFRLCGVILAMALVSAILMVVLYDPHSDPSRVYYGTDTRALELLIGAALATMWPSRRLKATIPAQARRIIDASGVAGLLIIGLMIWQTEQFSPFLYRGGFVLLSIGTALAVAAMAHPASRLGPIVGCAPLRWIGERSYGIYLWHFPIIILTTPTGATTTMDLPRNCLQVAATFLVAALSWKYVENPIRHGALVRFRARIREGRFSREQITRPGWAIIGSCGIVVVLATAGFAGVGVGPEDAGALSGTTAVEQTATSGKVVQGDPNKTVCTGVVHVGDSTSLGLVSPNYLPNPKQRMSAQYGRVGATTQHFEITAGQSIYETFEGNPNAHDVAEAWWQRGFRGCWVFALGTNEAADVSVGSAEGFAKRIDSMMSVARGGPVLWLTVKTLVTDGPYAETNMRRWNAALLKACGRYPNMRVYDWASDVRDSWFIDDGIHFTTPGYAARSKFIASALLDGFRTTQPIDRPVGTSCVIHPDESPPKHSKRDPNAPA
jgi:peptidoglycan/LPS O-acetylase OafA/YrhL